MVYTVVLSDIVAKGWDLFRATPAFDNVMKKLHAGTIPDGMDNLQILGDFHGSFMDSDYFKNLKTDLGDIASDENEIAVGKYRAVWTEAGQWKVTVAPSTIHTGLKPCDKAQDRQKLVDAFKSAAALDQLLDAARHDYEFNKQAGNLLNWGAAKELIRKDPDQANQVAKMLVLALVKS